jgi:hypothetical protein
LPPAFMLVSCSASSSTLKMEAICFSEMSVGFQWTTRCYVPEDSTHLVKNLLLFNYILLLLSQYKAMIMRILFYSKKGYTNQTIKRYRRFLPHIQTDHPQTCS